MAISFLFDNFLVFAKTGIKITMRVWLQMQHVPTSSLESDGMVRKLTRLNIIIFFFMLLPLIGRSLFYLLFMFHIDLCFRNEGITTR